MRFRSFLSNLVVVLSLFVGPSACDSPTGPTVDELQKKLELPSFDNNRISLWYDGGSWFMSMPVWAPVGVDPDVGVKVETTPTSTSGWLTARLGNSSKELCGSRTCQWNQFVWLSIDKNAVAGRDEADVILFAIQNTRQESRFRLRLINSPYEGEKGVMELVRADGR